MYVRNKKKVMYTLNKDIENEEVMKWMSNPDNKKKIINLMENKVEDTKDNKKEISESQKKILTKEEYIKMRNNYIMMKRNNIKKQIMQRKKYLKVSKSNGQASEEYVLKTSEPKYLNLEVKKAEYLHKKNLTKNNFDENGFLIKDNDNLKSSIQNDNEKSQKNILSIIKSNVLRPIIESPNLLKSIIKSDSEVEDYNNNLYFLGQNDDSSTPISSILNTDNNDNNDNNDEYPYMIEKIINDEKEKKIRKEELDIKDYLEILICKINTDIKSFEYDKIDDILPKNNFLNKYYISFFVVKMQDDSTMLLPFIVKMNKYLMKSYLYVNYVNDKIDEKLKLLYGVDYKLIDGDKNIKIMKNVYENNENILNIINEDKYKISEHNKKIIKNIVNPVFEKLFKSKKLTYDILDINLVLEFYNFYLNLYGKENIKYINFIWDTIDSDIEEDNLINKEYFVNISPTYFTDKIREDDFNVLKEDIIQINNIDNFIFKLDDLYDFKEIFKYKLENCLQYHFNNEIDIENIIDYFKIFKNFNKKKNDFQQILYKKVEENDKKKIKYLDINQKYVLPFTELDQTIRNEKIVIRNTTLNQGELELNDIYYLGSTNNTFKIDNNENNKEDNIEDNNELPKSRTYWFTNVFEKENENKNKHYTDLTDYYNFYDNKKSFDFIGGPYSNIPYSSRYSLDNFYSSPLENIYEKECKNNNKLDENKEKSYIYVLYDKEKKEGKIFEMEITNNFKNILQNNFDVWFGNDFDMYKIIEREKIQYSIEDMNSEFKDETFITKNMFVEKWKYLENKFIKEKVESKTKISKKLEIKECVEILNKYFDWSDNVENRIRSTELNNLFLEKINDYLGKINCYVEESEFIPLFLDIVKEVNLKKKRYSAGNFYYGILEKKQK